MSADLPLAAFVPGMLGQRGDLRLIAGNATVSWKGQPVRLTKAEAKIVTVLAHAAPRALTYREIIETMHRPGWAVSDDSVVARAHVKRIRQKFKAADPKFDRIETHYTVGYSWRG